MKVLILTEGGKKTGFGHVTRCSALRDAFAAHGIKATLIVNGDAAAKRQFGPQLDHVFNWLKDKSRINRLLAGASIVAVDSYLAPYSFYNKISKQVSGPVFFDDYLRFSYPSGIIVNGAIGAENFRYPKSQRIGHLLGAMYAPLRKEFWTVSGRKICRDMQNVLISFGGMDRGRFIRKLLSYLLPQFPGLRLHLVAPTGIRHPDVIPQRVRFYTGISARKLKKLMLSCDAAICGGGQTTYELAACGVPMIGICFAANQRFNLQGWQKSGALKYAGAYDQSAVIRRVGRLLKQMTCAARCRMSSSGRGSVDGRGALRIAKTIADLCFELRSVHASDRRLIFKWANDPDSRAVSFQTGTIGWAEHCVWFANKLKDPDHLFFVVMWKRKPVGQIRFERTGSVAVMSVSIAKEHRGKGLGVPMIRFAVQKVFREAGIRKIHAYVRPGNCISRKVFMRSGFALERKVRIHGQQAYLLAMRKDDE